MRKIYLGRPKPAGGLDLSYYLHYHWSANIFKCVYLVSTFENKDGPIWAFMEITVKPSNYSCLVPVLPLPMNLGTHVLNPIVKNLKNLVPIPELP
jgi:hypothetical protein